jgi:transposase
MEKNTVITQQEALISRLRNQISELTNGNSMMVEERSNNNSSLYFLNELKNLQHKYDSREDLIVSLQGERVHLLNEIDKLKGFRSGFDTFKPSRSMI